VLPRFPPQLARCFRYDSIDQLIRYLLETMAPKAAKISVSASGTKRKRTPSGSANSNKKPKFQSDPRNVRTQATDKAFKNGELNLGAFMQAREFEIRAMEQSLGESQRMRNSRAFQQLPRELRRRTASHNVKKTPKRLRRRVAKEVSRLVGSTCHATEQQIDEGR
jgi:ribonuclease P/MRP protein subunit POP1